MKLPFFFSKKMIQSQQFHMVQPKHVVNLMWLWMEQKIARQKRLISEEIQAVCFPPLEPVLSQSMWSHAWKILCVQFQKWLYFSVSCQILSPAVIQGDSQSPEYVSQDASPLRETANLDHAPFPNLTCYHLDQGPVRLSTHELVGWSLYRDLAYKRLHPQSSIGECCPDTLE